MRIQICCIGKLKNAPIADLCQLYEKRLRSPVEWVEFESKKKTLPDIHGDETIFFQKHFRPSQVKIILDERGKALTSKAFSKKIEAFKLQGRSNFLFIIGGADGLTPAIKEAADLSISFGAMTWPHMLVRAMLTEQLYRAQEINASGPYHREGPL